MDIFISGEVDSIIGEIFSEIRREISLKLKELKSINYGGEVESIGIIPIIARPEMIEAGFFKERQVFSKKKKEADLRLKIDFETFNDAERSRKRLLLVANIIECIRRLSVKATVDFDATRLESDILSLLDVTAEEISNYTTLE